MVKPGSKPSEVDFYQKKASFTQAALLPPFPHERKPQTHQTTESNWPFKFFMYKRWNNGVKPTLLFHKAKPRLWAGFDTVSVSF